MKAIVIIPTYNEKEGIARTIHMLENVLQKIKTYEVSVLVVDGNSPDGTAGAVRDLAREYRNIDLLVEEKKAGLGAAYLQAMEYAFFELKADIVFEFDSDLSHDPEKIPEFLDEIEKGADLVLGSRYIKGGSIPENWGIHRKFLSVFGNLFISLVMLSVHPRDWTTGYRAIKKWVYEAVKDKITEFKSYTFQICFLFNASRVGAKIAEVPINFIDRTRGKSKMPAIEYILHTFWFVVRSRVKEMVTGRFMKFAIVGFIGYLVNAFGLEFFYQVGFTPGIAAAMGGELAIISNFTWNNLWTFSGQKITGLKNILRKFFHFNLTSLGALVIQAVVVGGLSWLLGDQWRQIYLVIAIIFFIIPYNYSMYNLFIWKTWKLPFRR